MNLIGSMGKTDDPDSLGAVEFSSLDYDVVQDYEGMLLKLEKRLL